MRYFQIGSVVGEKNWVYPVLFPGLYEDLEDAERQIALLEKDLKGATRYLGIITRYYWSIATYFDVGDFFIIEVDVIEPIDISTKK